LLELGPQFHSPSLMLASDPRRKMNSARTRNCRGTPRPPHSLYVGDLLMQLDSTQSLQRDYIAIYRPNSTHATAPASSPRARARTHALSWRSGLLHDLSNKLCARPGLDPRPLVKWRPSHCCHSPRLGLLCFRRARRTRDRHGSTRTQTRPHLFHPFLACDAPEHEPTLAHAIALYHELKLPLP